MALPQLSPEARQQALAKAGAARRTRALVKEDLKKGRVELQDVIKRAETDEVLAKMKEFQATMGDQFKPSPLLEKLVAENKKFADL